MNYSPLRRIGWRYLVRHPWQSVLMIVGIALGTAVVISVDLANASASKAFDLSTQAVTGKTTHQITGGPGGVDQSVYISLKRNGLAYPAAPVIQEYISSDSLGERPLQMLGIDPFAEAPFRSYLAGQSVQVEPGNQPSNLDGDISLFLAKPGAVFLSRDLAVRYQLTVGDSFPINSGGNIFEATIAGLITPDNELDRQALDGLVLVDVATAQGITGRLNSLDRIDLILPEESVRYEKARNEIQALLPAGSNLTIVDGRSGTVEQMTAAFRINLTALSFLALVVGMFLIYNTITFSVVQRRPLFGTLRSLGVTRREVFSLVVGEALLIGFIGAIFGSLLGILLGQGTVRLVTQTINDLFFVMTVRGVAFPVGSIVKGSMLGIITTLLTAAPPAWEAASVPPRAALSRSGLERKTQTAIRIAACLGITLFICGILLLVIPTKSLLISFVGTFTIVIGAAMLVPMLTKYMMEFISPVIGWMLGIMGRMATRDVVSSLSRTAVAVMALMVAVSVTIGVSLMVSSFRTTVVTWLNETLQGDIYISAPGLTATTPSIPISPEVLDSLQKYPKAKQIDLLRSVDVESPLGMIRVAATNNPGVAEERIFLSTEFPKEQIWQEMNAGSVLVSEPLANRLDLPMHGGSIVLNTNLGPREFPISGIYYDYASTQGTILMPLSIYQDMWDDPAITAAAIRLIPGEDVDLEVEALQGELVDQQSLTIRANKSLRDEVLVVFDRTFAITGALQLLATIVAFIGVLSALLSLELERQRELGILRSIGLTVRQLWGLMLLETGLMGGTAGLLSMPTGYLLAIILIYIINKRSFGWTLQMSLNPEPFLEAFLVATIAALIAGIYPAFRIGNMAASQAMRSE